MDYQLFKIVGALAGLGGIGVAAVVYIFREIIRKEIFPQLTKNQAYTLLNRMIVLTSIIGFVGIVAYVALSFLKEPTPSNQRDKHATSSTPTPPTNVNGIRDVQTSTPTPTKTEVGKLGHNNQPSSPLSGNSRVSGFVFDENKKPLVGATISIDDFAGMKPVKTASNGSFSLEKIPKQNREMIRIRVTLDGYVTEVRDVVIGNYPRVITLVKIK
jgi:hypothetical protein